MISDKLRCIYIHIPKTGGMSVETMLGMDVKKSMLSKEGICIKKNKIENFENFFFRF